MLRIAITGPESTGKTQLCMALSEHYACAFVSEKARDYLEERGGKYERSDLDQILKLQLAAMHEESGKDEQMLICDSDELVIKIWSNYKYKSESPLIKKAWEEADHDLYLLMYPDLEWEYDPLREAEFDRMELFRLYEKELIEQNRPYSIIKGLGVNRLKNAIAAIEQMKSSL